MAAIEAELRKSSARSFDGLTFFTFLWSNIAVLQCVKHFHSLKQNGFLNSPVFDVLFFLLLVAAVMSSMLIPHRSSALVSLCLTHILSLVYHGSQSNHVIMAIITASAVLLSYSNDRAMWQQRLSSSAYLILTVLYFVSWTHKLNKNWFDRNYSCASLFASGFLSMWMPVSISSSDSLTTKFADLIIQTAPQQAVFIEIALPSLLIAWGKSGKKLKGFLFKVIMVTGALFHLIICLPLPPMSVYPFSMVMVPLYVLLLPKESFCRVQKLTSNIWTFGTGLAVMSMLVQYSLQQVLRGERMPLEYPAYNLWTISIIWNIVTWAIILYAALGVQSPYSSLNFPTLLHSRRGIYLASFLGFIGACPYLGIRNYPALAMFSNLRTEGNAANHLILPKIGILNYQYDTVKIHNTNLKSLLNYQVNLAEYFSEHTKTFNTAHGVRNEFWITPPSWTAPDSRPIAFVPFSIPVLEFRKHLSTHRSHSHLQGFYVNYTRNSEPGSTLFNSSDPIDFNSDSDILAPVSWWQRVLFRFRSFDSDYSPCRHWHDLILSVMMRCNAIRHDMIYDLIWCDAMCHSWSSPLHFWHHYFIVPFATVCFVENVSNITVLCKCKICTTDYFARYVRHDILIEQFVTDRQTALSELRPCEEMMHWS